MARPRTSTAVPSAAELYPKSPLGWMYDHTVGWALDHKLASTAVAIAAAGTIAAAVLLSPSGSAREAVNANTGSQSGSSAVIQTSSSQPRETIVDTYYSNVRASLLQDVPELANYQSALDYTSQRMVDMENVYGLSLDQVRAPVAKWVQANIDWDKKGERSVAFSEEIDFIPNDLIFKNVTTDRSRDIGAAQSIKNVADRFIFNTEWMMQEHDNTWREVNDPKIVEKAFEYLEALAQPGVLYEGVGASFPPYVKAIREKGTFEDKAHWSLYVKGRKNAPDEIRQHVGLGYILSVGGDAKIEIWGFGNYTDKSGKTRSGDGHGDLAVAMSPELRKYIESDPATFGHLLDTEYLGILPSREGVEAQGTLGTNNGVKFVVIWRELPSKRLGTPNRTFIYGDEAIARANGHR